MKHIQLAIAFLLLFVVAGCGGGGGGGNSGGGSPFKGSKVGELYRLKDDGTKDESCDFLVEFEVTSSNDIKGGKVTYVVPNRTAPNPVAQTNDLITGQVSIDTINVNEKKFVKFWVKNLPGKAMHGIDHLKGNTGNIQGGEVTFEMPIQSTSGGDPQGPIHCKLVMNEFSSTDDSNMTAATYYLRWETQTATN